MKLLKIIEEEIDENYKIVDETVLNMIYDFINRYRYNKMDKDNIEKFVNVNIYNYLLKINEEKGYNKLTKIKIREIAYNYYLDIKFCIVFELYLQHCSSAYDTLFLYKLEFNIERNNSCFIDINNTFKNK